MFLPVTALLMSRQPHFVVCFLNENKHPYLTKYIRIYIIIYIYSNIHVDTNIYIY